jgi:hypothetical protein
MDQFSTSFSSSFSSEPPPSGSVLIPIMGSGSNSGPVYVSIFMMEDSGKPSNRVSTEYYNKPYLNKSEACSLLGWSDTTLDRLSNAYPFIKTKIPKTRSIIYIKEEIDKVIRGEYD